MSGQISMSDRPSAHLFVKLTSIQIPQILAHEFDESAVLSLVHDFQDAMNLIVKPRDVLYALPELKLFISTLYYYISYLCNYNTPGQDLLGIHLLKEIKYNGRGLSSKFLLYYLSDLLTQLQLPGLTALISYCFDRRYEIGMSLISATNTLVTNEGDSDSNTTYFDVENVIRREAQNVLETLKMTWTNIASDESSRIELLTNVMKELHFIMFCFSSKYYNATMRVCGIRSFAAATGRRKRQMSLKILGWLMIFRYTILSVNAIKTLLRHYSQIITRDQSVLNDYSSPSVNSGMGNTIERIGINALKCPLCMDYIKEPCATPCGHVYCWCCLVPWTQRQKRSRGNAIKCPVCRMTFSRQSIRPIYY